MKISTALILLILFSQSACTSILFAPFSGDTLGSLPDKSLAGAPRGDQLIYNPQIENRLEVVNFNGRSLRISDLSPSSRIPYSGTWTTFQATTTSQVATEFVYSWTGEFNFGNTGNDFIIDCSVVNANTRIRLIVKTGGELYYTTDFLNEFPLTTLQEGETHGIFIRARPNSENYDVLVSQNGNISEFNDLDFINQGSGMGTFSNPAIAFNYSNGRNNSQRSYTVDQVRISRRDNNNSSGLGAAIPLTLASLQRLWERDNRNSRREN